MTNLNLQVKLHFSKMRISWIFLHQKFEDRLPFVYICIFQKIPLFGLCPCYQAMFLEISDKM